jgi:hypothetical protein
LVTEPRVFDPRSGKLLPDAVAQVHRAGLSVLRDCAADQEFNETFLIMKVASDAKGNERFWHSVSTVLTKNIRYNGAERALAVFDTAYASRPAHADIMAPPGNKLERARQTRILLDKLSAGLTSVANFRQGTFSSHARPM